LSVTNVAGTVEYTYVAVPSAPAGTPESAPTRTAVVLNQGSHLWRVEVRIPAGHQGVTGLALVDSGQYILPYEINGTAWLVGDDDLLEYPYGKTIGSNVVFLAYNTGIYNHAWQCRLIWSPAALVDTDQAVITSPDVADWLAEVEGAGE